MQQSSSHRLILELLRHLRVTQVGEKPVRDVTVLGDLQSDVIKELAFTVIVINYKYGARGIIQIADDGAFCQRRWGKTQREIAGQIFVVTDLVIAALLPFVYDILPIFLIPHYKRVDIYEYTILN